MDLSPMCRVLGHFFYLQKQNGCYNCWKTLRSGLSLQHECKKRMWYYSQGILEFDPPFQKWPKTVVFLLFSFLKGGTPWTISDGGKANMCQGRNFRQCGRSSHLELENPSGGYLNPLLSGYIGFMTIPYHSEPMGV